MPLNFNETKTLLQIGNYENFVIIACSSPESENEPDKVKTGCMLRTGDAKATENLAIVIANKMLKHPSLSKLLRNAFEIYLEMKVKDIVEEVIKEEEKIENQKRNN